MAPEDLIELGVVRGAYGLKGWVRVAPFAADGSVLEAVPNWWLLSNSEPRSLQIQGVKRHVESIVAKWQGCDSKEAADALRGATLAVPRSAFPPAGAGAHYLSDVIGHRVVNRQGIELGTVSGLRFGKHREQGGVVMQWLEVKSTVERISEGRNSAAAPLLIPLVDQYVDSIETDVIKVDWEAGW
ncbi:MAG: 16S rRNA processing protein RimM [Burkholderiaceae bacterium]|nr:16S rRNA processing protein RimM [Burkholderiaceae bacterium]